MALMGDRIGDEIVAYSMKEHYRTKTAFKVKDLHPELGIKAWDYFQEKIGSVCDTFTSESVRAARESLDYRENS